MCSQANHFDRKLKDHANTSVLADQDQLLRYQNFGLALPKRIQPFGLKHTSARYANDSEETVIGFQNSTMFHSLASPDTAAEHNLLLCRERFFWVISCAPSACVGVSGPARPTLSLAPTHLFIPLILGIRNF